MDEEKKIALRNHLQALLFVEGGTMQIKRLAQLTQSEQYQVFIALEALKELLQGTGLTLVSTDTEATLAVAPTESALLKEKYEKDLGKEIGDAGLEVLAILLYRGNSSRSEIDYIRGVNTASTMRNLLARGLIERVPNPKSGREYLYKPTAELLAYLGKDSSLMPDYDIISRELSAFEEASNFFKENANTYDGQTNEDGGESIVDN